LPFGIHCSPPDKLGSLQARSEGFGETRIDSNIILHVHDELVLELKKKDLEKVTELIKNTMEDCVKLRVKLKVDIKTGQNWYI
ncbi:MAG: DNA polymerase, partial [Candidatus Humimicrobiaceae bacterium]